MKQIVSHLSQKMIAALVMGIAATASAGPRDYMVIDLSGGPNAKTYPVSYSAEPPDLDFDTCRTKELWLRLIPAGTFMMGSPADEWGRRGKEDLHQVTLSQPFYMGVFEVTQKQYELVMGRNPASQKGDTRPVASVSYNALRGKQDGSQWPAHNNVDADSFFGVLRGKTSLLADLPTEAQWEYACRAGTTTSLYNGKNLTADNCPNVAEIGRYLYTQKDGKGGQNGYHTKVGMYLPNAYGLYDMIGNVLEWCLDWDAGGLGTGAVTDPKGPTAPSEGMRIRHGGTYQSDARGCRAAFRTPQPPDRSAEYDGFRIAIHLDSAQTTTPPIAPLTTGTLATTDDEKLAAACAEFKSVLDSYKEGAEKINAEFQPKFEALNQQYAKALDTLKTTVQGRGDFEKTKAVTAEIERFGKEKSIPSAPDEKAIAEIKTLQTNAIKPFTALEKDMLTRLVTLAQRYEQALGQVQAGLVRAGKLDDATGVNEAKKRAKQSADDLTAQLAARNPQPVRPGGRR